MGADETTETHQLKAWLVYAAATTFWVLVIAPKIDDVVPHGSPDYPMHFLEKLRHFGPVIFGLIGLVICVVALKETMWLRHWQHRVVALIVLIPCLGINAWALVVPILLLTGVW